VEFPHPSCTGTVKKAETAAAREAFVAACGAPPTPEANGRTVFGQLEGTATVTGVAVVDVVHEVPQRGVAPIDIELHPVIGFEARAADGGDGQACGGLRWTPSVIVSAR